VNFSVEHLGLPARDPAALKDLVCAHARRQGGVLQCPDTASLPLALPGQLMIEIYGGNSSLPQTSDNKLNGWRHVALRVTR